jgi:hypothetical protein
VSRFEWPAILKSAAETAAADRGWTAVKWVLLQPDPSVRSWNRERGSSAEEDRALLDALTAPQRSPAPGNLAAAARATTTPPPGPYIFLMDEIGCLHRGRTLVPAHSRTERPRFGNHPRVKSVTDDGWTRTSILVAEDSYSQADDLSLPAAALPGVRTERLRRQPIAPSA